MAKTIKELFIQLKNNEITKKKFLYEARRDSKLSQWITNVTPLKEAIKILQNKGIINEEYGNYDDFENEDDQFEDEGNIAFNLMTKLDSGEGDEVDADYLKDFTGRGDMAYTNPVRAFSVNEENDSYKLAFNFVTGELQNLWDNVGEFDSNDKWPLLDQAKAKFSLNKEEYDRLSIDIFDWVNKLTDHSYDDEFGGDLDEQSNGEYTLNQPEYEWYTVQVLDSGLNINEGFEYRGDAIGRIKELKDEGIVGNFKVLSGKFLKSKKIDLNDNKWWKEVIDQSDIMEEYPLNESENKVQTQSSTSAPGLPDVQDHPEFDNLNLNVLLKGARFEYEKTNRKDWEKSYVKAGKNLLKDPLHYFKLINNVPKTKKRTDLSKIVKTSSPVDKENASKPVKGSKVPKGTGKIASTNKNKVKTKSSGYTKTIKENQEQHINWDNISEKDANSLFDYHERTGMLPFNLTPEKYEEIMLKYNIKKDNDRDIDPAGGRGLHSHLEESKQQKLNTFKKLIKETFESYIKTPEYKQLKEGLTKKKTIEEGLFNEDHLDSKEAQINYIVQNRTIFSRPDEITHEYLNNLTNNYINKLYLAVEKKVIEKANLDASGQEPEYYSLKEEENKSKIGSSFTVSAPMGKFKVGEKVTIVDITNDEDGDTKFTLRNEQGVEDFFFMDPNDSFEGI